MNYYIDIKLLPDEEISLEFLWKKMYLQVHLALVEMKDKDNLVGIGLSFPHYQEGSFSLGNILRVFSHSKEELEKFNLEHWLKRLNDYLIVSAISEVPDKIEKFASFRRKQFKTNVERLARRQAKRKNISYEEALKNYENFDEDKNKTKLPYVNIKSLSSNKEMKIFIEKVELKEEKKGMFSTYGLSKTATVPWF